MKTSSMSILDILNTDADESTTRMSLDTDRITLVDRELDVDTVQDVDMEIDLDDHTSQPYTTDSNEQYQESDQQPASDDIIAAKVLESLDGSSKPGVKNDKFLKRVYSIPFLNNTVNSINNCYESTKNISGVLKYSAESVESVTMRVTLPVLNTLEPVLTPLDRFACNQLDRVEKRFPFISGYTHPPSDQPLPSNDSIYKMESGDAGNVENGQVQEKTQSRWPKVVGSVGANLGVLKKETVAALRYCIEIIQYATSAIAGQINTLRQAIKFEYSNLT